MLRHLCIELKILAQWLKTGFVEKGQLFSTVAGKPQGGIISPCLANGVLDGMESMLKSSIKSFLDVIRKEIKAGFALPLCCFNRPAQPQNNGLGGL